MYKTHFVPLVAILLFITNVLYANPTNPTRLPSPFFFTENRGQWDARVLYKCQAKNGMTWFLERDGITLLVSREQGTGNREHGEQSVRRTFLSDDYSSRVRPSGSPDENDLPEMLRRHPQKKYPMKSHALKFHFVKGEGSKVKGEGSKVNGARSAKEDSENLDQSSSTQHPTPYTLNPSPDFLHPTPYTLHQSFSTLHRAEAQSVEAQGELPWKNNYFLGNDSTKWAPNCRNFSTVIYREVWDGIDIEWYENDGKLEFDFIVHPGFDPSQIRMSVEGLEGDRISGFGAQETGLSLRGSAATKQSHLDKGNREPETGNGENVRDLLRDSRTTGGTTSRTPSPESRATVPCSLSPVPELRLQTSLGELRTALPSVYQVSANGTRNEIEAAFELTDKNIFGITLPNGYNPDHSLRIDPLIYSTFLGGTGDDAIQAMVGDGSGGVFLTGWARSTDFPTTPGVGQRTNWGGSDCFVTHLDSTGTQLIYSTYIGGSDDEDGSAIVSDQIGGVVLTGSTMSSNYPTTPGAVQRLFGGYYDCFVTRLNSTGSALMFSSYLGGSSFDGGTGIVFDNEQNIYILGVTLSNSFPTTNGVFDRTFNGGNDCFILHMSSLGTSIIQSTFLGGSGDDGGMLFRDDQTGDIIVVGSTSSQNFPTTQSSYCPIFNGGNYDCFLTRLDWGLTSLIASTFVGGLGVDGVGNARYENGIGVSITGSTSSQNYPTTIGAYDQTFNGDRDIFVSLVDNSFSNIVYSTFLGTQGSEFAMDIERNSSNDIVITGQTSSSNFPTTIGAFDTSYNGGANGDCFVSMFDSTCSHLLYSTFLGGSGFDRGYFIAADNNDDVIVAGYTSSADFPTTTTSFDPTYNGAVYDGFVTKLNLVADTSNLATEHEMLPHSFSLSQNYPNPFNSSTTISYSLPKPGHVDLRLFDITGREVATLVNQKQQTGSYQVTIDGQKLSSGTYFVQMQAGEFVKTQKMVLLR